MNFGEKNRKEERNEKAEKIEYRGKGSERVPTLVRWSLVAAFGIGIWILITLSAINPFLGISQLRI